MSDRIGNDDLGINLFTASDAKKAENLRQQADAEEAMGDILTAKELRRQALALGVMADEKFGWLSLAGFNLGFPCILSHLNAS